MPQEETSTERNNILQKAIRLFINKNKDQLSIEVSGLPHLSALGDITGCCKQSYSSPILYVKHKQLDHVFVVACELIFGSAHRRERALSSHVVYQLDARTESST